MVITQQKREWPALWEQAEASARSIIDGMGSPLDEGIVETVVAFNLLGLRTCQSCEGHLDGGLPYPWIDFETDEFPTFKQALEDASRKELSAQEREAKGAHLVSIAAALPSRGLLYARMEELLCTYYQQHATIPEEWRLVVQWSSPILFRLMPWCGYEATDWNETRRAYYLKRTQAEMQAFTAFLKQLCWQKLNGDQPAMSMSTRSLPLSLTLFQG